jgi:sulfotransferase family protein
MRTPVSPADLIDKAKRRCGLDDFGDGDFFEPLSRLVESCQREAQLNSIGKIALRADLVRTLCNRLLMEQDRHLHPQIAREEIREPLFIIGLPRSGTTLLHTLLAADPEHRTPLTWEVMSPSPPTNDDIPGRIRHAERSLASLQWLAPTFRRVHAMGAELPQECVGLMSPSFLSDQFDTMYNVPSYRAWFLKQDLSPAYHYHRRFLQHLQQRRRARRWVLKAPVHMFALPTLLSVYPDARFVQTHRAPLKAITSVSSLIAILRGVFSNVVDSAQIARDALQYWSETTATFMQERDRLPAERICDVSYHAIRRDPIVVIQKVYEHFGWSLSREAEQRMRTMLANQPREQNGFHHYEPAQFDLDAAEVDERFSAYCERFGLSEQVPSRAAEGSGERMIPTNV